MTGLAWWSQTANSNADGNGDTAIGWAEGQAPSTVNNSARAMMASTAKWRDDISGAITTGGSSTAYTVASYQQFDNLSRLANQVIAFTPHATSGTPATLNVDSLGAKPLRSSPGAELPINTLIQGTPYLALYNNSDGAFYLQGFCFNPYNIPLGGMLDFIGGTTPNSSFVFPAGQAISRTTYAALFSLVGTSYGTGDGSTTFNVPDLTGRIVAMKEASATRLTTAGSGIDGGTLGATGGAQNITMARANLPNTSVSVAITDPSHAHSTLAARSETATSGSLIGSGSAGNISYVNGSVNTSSATTGISAAFNLNGNVTQTAMIVAQPTIVLNKILRII